MKSILYIGNALSRHGKNPTAIETLGTLLEKNGFAVTYSSSKINKVFRLLDMILTTGRNLKKVDYVLIDTYSTQNFWYALLISQICRFAKLKYLPILHGGYLPERIAKNPKLSSMIFDHSFINVAPSNFMLDAMTSAGFNNVVLIPNHIDIHQYTFRKRSLFSPRILWVRSFAPIYNPKMAIQVFAEVQKHYENSTFCMVGPDNGSLDEVQDFAKSLNIKVLFPGKLSKEIWISMSEEYDIFINTSHADNTPVSVIEAMALGLCVISTNVGGIPHLISHNSTGLLVNDGDYEDMANKITMVISGPQFASKLTENARTSVTNFDQKVILDKWFSLLN